MSLVVEQGGLIAGPCSFDGQEAQLGHPTACGGETSKFGATGRAGLATPRTPIARNSAASNCEHDATDGHARNPKD